MGNVSIKHNRRPIFENPLSERNSYNHRPVIKSSRYSPFSPSTPLSKRTKQPSSPIMPNRYVHKSVLKTAEKRHSFEGSPYLLSSRRNDGYSGYSYYHQNSMTPRNSQRDRMEDRINDSLSSQHQELERREIMKKIRNFNEFINMVKKEIHETKEANNSLKVKMELENRDFDVSRYQQILEKEFSRNGSQAKIKFEDQNAYKVLNISFENLKDAFNGQDSTEKSSKILKTKQELRERMREATERLRQLSEKLYQDIPDKHLGVNRNLVNIENILDNKDHPRCPNVPPCLTKIHQNLSKMMQLNKEQYHNNMRALKDLDQSEQQCQMGLGQSASPNF